MRQVPAAAHDHETIGQRLRRLRTERGFSQRDLSAPGVSYAYISRIEAGARQPSVKALRMLARKLGVSPDYLETGRELRDQDQRELRLSELELQLRLGDESEVADDLRALLAEAEAAGDAPTAGRTRVVLGFAAARAGDDATAVALLQDAVDDGRASVVERPDVYSQLGRSLAATGRERQAVELFENCLHQVTEHEPENVAAQIRFATYLSYALTDLGETRRAESVLGDALARAGDIADPFTRVRLYWSLGRLAANEGRYAESLMHTRKALALLEATEDTMHLGRAHITVAWVMNSSGRADEATGHLDIADRLLGPNPDASDKLSLAVERARNAVGLGRFDDAIRSGNDALAIAGEAYPTERGCALYALAQAHEALDSMTEAEASYAAAAELLAVHGSPADRSDAFRGWARFLRRNGRESEALDVLDRAADVVAHGDG
jgi:transcriptional regulator with XRE-family HTH domain